MTTIILSRHPAVELGIVDFGQHLRSIWITPRPIDERLLYGFLLFPRRRCFWQIHDLTVALRWMWVANSRQLLIETVFDQFHGATAMGAKDLGIVWIVHQSITRGAKKPPALVRDVTDGKVKIVFTHSMIIEIPFAHI